MVRTATVGVAARSFAPSLAGTYRVTAVCSGTTCLRTIVPRVDAKRGWLRGRKSRHESQDRPPIAVKALLDCRVLGHRRPAALHNHAHARTRRALRSPGIMTIGWVLSIGAATRGTGTVDDGPWRTMTVLLLTAGRHAMKRTPASWIGHGQRFGCSVCDAEGVAVFGISRVRSWNPS